MLDLPAVPPGTSLPFVLYVRSDPRSAHSNSDSIQKFGGQARIRTLEAIRQQIYSLPPLSTWVPARLSHRQSHAETVFPGKSLPKRFIPWIRRMKVSLTMHSFPAK